MKKWFNNNKLYLAGAVIGAIAGFFTGNRLVVHPAPALLHPNQLTVHCTELTWVLCYWVC